MPIFTLPGGALRTINANAVVRCRDSFAFENDGHIGTTLFKPRLIVMEPITLTGPALHAERASFVRLSGIDDRHLWFDATQADDAEPPKPHESANGVNAIIPVDGIRMRVTESVADAQAAIDAGRAAV